MTVTCNDCGACCLHLGSPPFCGGDDKPPPELWAAIGDYLESPRYSSAERPCFWLDMPTGKCSHYEHRPQVCRDFELGGTSCLQTREAYESVVALTIGAAL